MGIFDRFLKKRNSEKLEIQEEPDRIYAPVRGNYIPLEEIPDEVFSQGMLGRGCGVEPVDGKIYAPASGTVTVVADTKHAVGITGEDGEEYLIHIGLETVSMNGKGFYVHVDLGENVQAGQLLMEADLDEIRKSGCNTISGFVVPNAEEYPGFMIETGQAYEAGEVCGKRK